MSQLLKNKKINLNAYQSKNVIKPFLFARKHYKINQNSSKTLKNFANKRTNKKSAMNV